MSESSIDRALELAAVAALGADFVGKIAFEGQPFEPGPNDTWAQLTNLRAGVEVASLGEGGMDEHTGVYQIDVNVPRTGGDPRAVLLAHADRIRGYFVAGRRFSHDNQGVRVQSAGVSFIRRVEGWQRITVSVAYSAFSIRPAF